MGRSLDAIGAHWPAPTNVNVWVTTRRGGVSQGRYRSLNLAAHVGDQLAAVQANRRRLRDALGLPAEPRWLHQVHGTRVLRFEAEQPRSGARAASLEQGPRQGPRTADAAVTAEAGVVCAVLTADCVPVLLCNRQGTEVGVAHAGWRGLAQGVLEAVVGAFRTDPEDLLAWLGPGIGADAYQVGDEVREAFLACDPLSETCFQPARAGQWLADLAALARRRLMSTGVKEIHRSGLCTHADATRFFSYRRDGETGRMASLIWLAY